MRVHNLVPAKRATPPESELGDGVATLHVDTELRVALLADAAKREHVANVRKQTAGVTPERKSIGHWKAIGLVICQPTDSPCTVDVPLGSQWLIVGPEPAEARAVNILVDGRPLQLRVRDERNPALGVVAYTLLGVGGYFLAFGGVAALTGEPRGEGATSEEVSRRGLALMGVGIGAMGLGYLFHLGYDRGELTIGPYRSAGATEP